MWVVPLVYVMALPKIGISFPQALPLSRTCITSLRFINDPYQISRLKEKVAARKDFDISAGLSLIP